MHTLKEKCNIDHANKMKFCTFYEKVQQMLVSG